LPLLLAAEPSDNHLPALRVANPQSLEQSQLRPSLIGSLLLTLRANLRQRERVLIYELARTWQGSLDPSPDERRHVGIAMVGPRNPRHWASPEGDLDFFDAKGIVDALCDAFRVPVSYIHGHHPSLHPGRTSEVCIGNQRLGVIGQLHPAVAERLDLTGAPVLVAELDFERLIRSARPILNIETPSRFPAADRDISFFIDESIPHADLEAAIEEAAGDLLESVRLFDVFRGGSVPAGRQSLAFALRYRAPDRTLEDDEVSAAHARVEESLHTRFGAEIRGRS
jgi:phenylalanyl-tRNA synthetase beta chain